MDQQHVDEAGSRDPEGQDHGPQDQGHSDLEGVASGAGEGTTGMPEVDAVLASLDGLDGRPVAEHVEVFEKAHERLRRALDTPAG